MKFVNTRNGIVIDMPDDWRGDCWVPVEEPTPAPNATPKASETDKPAPAANTSRASTARRSKK